MTGELAHIHEHFNSNILEPDRRQDMSFNRCMENLGLNFPKALHS